MAREIKKTDQFKERLLKLIPSEIIAAYAVIQGLVADQESILIYIVIGVLTLIAFIYMHKLEKVTNTWHKVVVALAFPIWAFTVTPEAIPESVPYNRQLAPILLVVWTLLIPLVIKNQGDKDNPTP